MSVRNLIRQSAVTLICTTDDPADDLKWHKAITEDSSFEVHIVTHQLPQLCDVEGRKPCTAGNQNRLRGFASRQLVLAVLLDRKVVRVAGCLLYTSISNQYPSGHWYSCASLNPAQCPPWLSGDGAGRHPAGVDRSRTQSGSCRWCWLFFPCR